MNLRKTLAILVLLPAAQLAQAQEPSLPTLPPVQAARYTFDCHAPRTLPSQVQVGEWFGQHNLGQVYATRQWLMGEVARACLAPGIARVGLVLEETGGSPDHRVARLEPEARRRIALATTAR